ncbi:MAG: hypothetical protein KDD36_14280 [Flavobacteriales bacterium]|nr:hypothetical protein [Flavobacteriales bacterium]
MKRSLRIIALITLSYTAVFSQKIKVSETSTKINGGSHNALVVTMNDVSPDDVEKEWKSLMKGYKAKVSSKDEVFADNALIKSISENTLDIYAIAQKKDNTVTLYVAVDMGGAYMSSANHPTEYKVMEKIVYDFAVKTMRETIANELKEEEKLYSKLEKEQSDLEKTDERLHKDIEQYKSEIEKLKNSITQAEKDIEQNKKDQEKKKTEVAAQKKVVEAVQAKQKAIN